MQKIVADVLDELAGDFKSVAREPTTGATESQLLGTLSKAFVKRAALLRDAAAEAADAEERRQAAAAAAAERVPAGQDLPPDVTPAGGQITADFDPAEHSVNEVNDHLRNAPPAERTRVLDLEKQERPDVPAGKKQRAGILTGPFGDQSNP